MTELPPVVGLDPSLSATGIATVGGEATIVTKPAKTLTKRSNTAPYANARRALHPRHFCISGWPYASTCDTVHLGDDGCRKSGQCESCRHVYPCPTARRLDQIDAEVGRTQDPEEKP